MLSVDDFYHANEKDFITGLSYNKKVQLINAAKDGNPSDCMECMFFKWLLDKPGRFSPSCSLSFEEEIGKPMHEKLCPVNPHAKM